ncbi:Pyridoxal phosphate-dependent aminotransferase [Tumidithrix helvetica PCC 7403]|uniref:LegC family aminotransferase n=1 Tax=Tumidithrix helvetica TaxID=3457545 RepID=UPI003CB55397
MSHIDLTKLLKVLQGVLPKHRDSIGLHEPHFEGNEWLYAKECLDTGWVSSVGKFVDKFEEQLAAYTGVKHAIAVVNGTSALHICLQLGGVKTDDEVLIPSMTFVATTNAVSYCGAIPHFVDCDEKTLGLDPYKLGNYLDAIADLRPEGCWNRQTGRQIKAVVPVHTFGHPVDLEPLLRVCSHFNLALIEDAAESLGSFYENRHTGNWGLISALSFNGNKIVTTGGGGAILTNDMSLGKLAKHITTTAKVSHAWEISHDRVGYNYRLPNFNAALGCAQLEQLPKFLASKRSLAAQYERVLQGWEGLYYFTEPRFARSNYWLNVLLFDEECAWQRDEFLNLTNSNGIMTRPVWTPMHKLPMFTHHPRMDVSVTESLARRIINLPSSSFLAEEGS